MSFKFSKFFNIYYYAIIIFAIFISIFFIPFFSPKFDNSLNYDDLIISNDLFWPLPKYTRISSYFGNRSSPTAGASTFHGGVDIPAPEGTNIISPISRKSYLYWFYGKWWIYCYDF